MFGFSPSSLANRHRSTQEPTVFSASTMSFQVLRLMESSLSSISSTTGVIMVACLLTTPTMARQRRLDTPTSAFRHSIRHTSGPYSVATAQVQLFLLRSWLINPAATDVRHLLWPPGLRRRLPTSRVLIVPI